jgi:hypothetical protein
VNPPPFFLFLVPDFTGTFFYAFLVGFCLNHPCLDKSLENLLNISFFLWRQIVHKAVHLLFGTEPSYGQIAHDKGTLHAPLFLFNFPGLLADYSAFLSAKYDKIVMMKRSVFISNKLIKAIAAESFLRAAIADTTGLVQYARDRHGLLLPPWGACSRERC